MGVVVTLKQNRYISNTDIRLNGSYIGNADIHTLYPLSAI